MDEYGDDEEKLKEFLDELQSDEAFPNMKYIITTRLEAGIPEKLNISHYIRLLPLSRVQVNEFFYKYGLEFNFYKLQNYKLTEEEIRKPLFCRMFCIMMQSKLEDEIMLKDSVNTQMTRALIYEGFIHSIIRGKHKQVADEYHYTRSFILKKRKSYAR